MMQEDLAAMGQSVSDNNFFGIIMGSLPSSYDPYVSAVIATSSVLGTTLSANDLMLMLTEEYEHCTLKTKGGKKEDDAAFHSNDAEKGDKGGSNSKKNTTCHNCRKKGHYKKDCWAEGGGKEGQRPNQKGKGKVKGKGKRKVKGKGKGKEKETAAASEDKNEEKPKDEEVWMAMVFDDHLEEVSYNHSDDLVVDSHYEAAYSCFIEDETLTDCLLEHDLDISRFLDGVDEVFDVDHDLSAIPDDLKICTSFDYAYLVGMDET